MLLHIGAADPILALYFPSMLIVDTLLVLLPYVMIRAFDVSVKMVDFGCFPVPTTKAP